MGLSKKSNFLLDRTPQKSVNASCSASRLTTHDSGTVWLARPSPRRFIPAYPAVSIRGLWFADVFADLLQLKAHRGHCVSTGPEVLAREIPLFCFATQAGHRYGALPFQKSDHCGHRILRRDRHAHVHMVRQQVSLNDLALLLPRQCVEYFSQFAPCLAKQHLAPSLWHKHHMILTVPTGMR